MQLRENKNVVGRKKKKHSLHTLLEAKVTRTQACCCRTRITKVMTKFQARAMME